MFKMQDCDSPLLRKPTPAFPRLGRWAWMVLGTLLILSSGCSGPAQRQVELRFEARVGDQPAACGTVYRSVFGDGLEVALSDARFYVSNLEFIRPDGSAVPVQLEQESPWQYESVALLDFEDGSSRCSEAGTAQMNSVVTGTVPEGPIQGLRFEVGVPHDLNHFDAATAPSPLNINALYWNWRLGYIFAKVDFWLPGAVLSDEEQTADQQPRPNVSYLAHVGSTGCRSAAITTPPESPCDRPNKVSVELAQFDPENDVVVFDLLSLMDGIDVSQSVPRPPGCMSAPNDPDCSGLFRNLGLEIATGRCISDCNDQKLVRRDSPGGLARGASQ